MLNDSFKPARLNWDPICPSAKLYVKFNNLKAHFTHYCIKFCLCLYVQGKESGSLKDHEITNKSHNHASQKRKCLHKNEKAVF